MFAKADIKGKLRKGDRRPNRNDFNRKGKGTKSSNKSQSRPLKNDKNGRSAGHISVQPRRLMQNAENNENKDDDGQGEGDDKEQGDDDGGRFMQGEEYSDEEEDEYKAFFDFYEERD